MIDMDEIIKAALAVRWARDDLAVTEADLLHVIHKDRWIMTGVGRWDLPGASSRIVALHMGGYDWIGGTNYGTCATLEGAKAAAEACL